jgi:hypothetical protein
MSWQLAGQAFEEWAMAQQVPTKTYQVVLPSMWAGRVLELPIMILLALGWMTFFCRRLKSLLIRISIPI